MENNKNMILIHSDIESIPNRSSGKSIDIMLTPQFYTIKRENLPVKYAYQAKRIAPSLFDGLLEKSENYKYFVVREEDTWLFIAYDEEKIKVFLEEKKIDIAKISKIYFAEQVSELFTGPVLLGENNAMVNLNGVMTVVPQTVLSLEEESISMSKKFMPSKGITFEGNGKSIISKNETYTFAAIFILFAGIYFMEGLRYNNKSIVTEQKIEQLLEDNSKLRSKLQRDNIAEKYREIDNKERKKRDIIKTMSNMIFKGSMLTSLSLENKKLQAEFTYKNKDVVKKLKELANKEKFNMQEVVKNNTIKIEGTL